MRKTLLSLIFCILILLAGCGFPASKPELHSSTLFAMDTMMNLNVYGDEELLVQAREIIVSLEKKFSTTDSNSEIFALNQNKSGSVSSETAELLARALEMCRRTDGALDISIYPVVRLWGFTTGEYHVPDAQELTGLLQSVGYTGISIDNDGTVSLAPDMQIDLGSVAKGYTGNRIMTLFRENGVSSAMVNLGGNVQTLGAKPDGSPWRVAIANPAGNGYAGMIDVSGKAVITSGGYERFFESNGKSYHHIIDPSTGFPADNGLLSVTVVGEDGLICDALSTALFVLGLDKAVALWRDSDDFEAIFITSDGITITEGLTDCFSPYGDYENMEVTVVER